MMGPVINFSLRMRQADRQTDMATLSHPLPPAVRASALGGWSSKGEYIYPIDTNRKFHGLVVTCIARMSFL